MESYRSTTLIEFKVNLASFMERVSPVSDGVRRRAQREDLNSVHRYQVGVSKKVGPPRIVHGNDFHATKSAAVFPFT